LLLEDEPLDIEPIKRALRAVSPECEVHRVGNGDSFEQALIRVSPDVILADYDSARSKALEALRHARRTSPECPFLLVSRTLDSTSADFLREGAVDLIDRSELNRLSSVVRAAVAERAPLRTLSRRQREVLQLVVDGLSTRAIADRLNLSVKTVETHRALMMKRLGISELAGLVKYAIRIGIVSANQ